MGFTLQNARGYLMRYRSGLSSAALELAIRGASEPFLVIALAILFALTPAHLPDNLSAPDATLRQIVDVNAGLLGVGIPKASMAGWNAYLVS